MKKKLAFALILLTLLTPAAIHAAWSYFQIPRIILGGSTGYFRASLDNFTRIYASRWDNYNSAQLSVRVYRTNYLSIQYANFQKEATDNAAYSNARWQERFINFGLRWYSETRKRWRFYSGFGFVFVKIKEKAGLSLLKPNHPEDVTTNGSGFYLEIGADYIILPHLGLNLELEASSAGEGGTPGFMGSSLGGYALLAGLNFHF